VGSKVVTLDGAVRMVALQFNFSNPRVIPESVKHLSPETPRERVERKSCSTGVQVIEPTGRCSLVEFLGELGTTGYEMIDAFYKERIDQKDPSGQKKYYMVRFLFCRHESATPSEAFKKVRGDLRADLRTICEDALWRVRAFNNPFYRDGVEVPEQRALSVNLEARVPLFEPNGQRIMAREKDENGQKAGPPLALMPSHYLRVVDDAVTLVVAA